MKSFEETTGTFNGVKSWPNWPSYRMPALISMLNLSFSLRRPVILDPAAESKLRLKIDFFVVPTVSLLYLFCFIDRANLGESNDTS
jgi:hypothetical protein